jgi:hypothetical protein
MFTLRLPLAAERAVHDTRGAGPPVGTTQLRTIGNVTNYVLNI